MIPLSSLLLVLCGGAPALGWGKSGGVDGVLCEHPRKTSGADDMMLVGTTPKHLRQANAMNGCAAEGVGCGFVLVG